MKMFLILLIVSVIVIGAWFVKTRNRLVTLDENVNQTWAQVQNAYQRRLDLIPNLVATVQGYAFHERDTLTEVTEARSRVGQLTAQGMQNILEDPQAFARFQEAQGALSSALSRLMVVVERYPELRANENFMDLQRQLEGTENRITVERMRFNEASQSYNTAVRVMPASLVAGFTGFRPRNYFQSAPGAETAPKVQFGTPAPATP